MKAFSKYKYSLLLKRVELFEKLASEKSHLKVDEDGNKRWYNDKGELHRIGGPAVE